MGAEKERIIPMADCDHREICMYAERTSNYKKLLGAIRECIQRETLIPQGTFPTFFWINLKSFLLPGCFV